MNCKNCKYWKQHKEWYGADSFYGVDMGMCTSDKWASNPNYYTEYSGTSTDDMVLVTHNANTGANFGCVHFEEGDGGLNL